MKTVDLQQNTPEWELLRRSHIGASDVAILMTGSEHEIYNLYLRKTTGEKIAVNAAMQRGHDLEPDAVRYYELKTGWKYPKVTGISEEYPWLMASFDGLDVEANVPLEVKCPMTMPDEVHHWKGFEKAYWQVQGQMLVCGAKEATLLLYSPEKQIEKKMKREDAQILKIIEKTEMFSRYLTGDLEFPIPFQQRFDEEWFDAEAAWEEAKNLLEEAQERESICRDALLYLTGENSSRGNRVSVTRIVRRGAVEYTKIPQLKDLDLEVYRKPSIISWRVSKL